MMVYCLMMDKIIDGAFVSYDVFGLYSTFELAMQAKKWREVDNGYLGCDGRTIYDNCFVVTRIIDCNLP